MDWNKVVDATEGLKVEAEAAGDQPQPEGTFPAIRRGGPRDGAIMFWGRVPGGGRQPIRMLVSEDEAFIQYEDE